MTKTVEFLFDFGSPNAYLSHRVVPAIEARTGARFVYVPVLLGGLFKLTNNQPPMVAFGNIKNKLSYEMLETRRFVARHRLDAFTFNPHFPVNTAPAHARRGGGRAGRPADAVRRGRLPAHVGATEEDGRPGRLPRGAASSPVSTPTVSSPAPRTRT